MRGLTQPPRLPDVSALKLIRENAMSDLRTAHVDTNIDPGNRGKIIAGILVALVIIAIGAFGWQAGWWQGLREAVPDQNLPLASIPVIPPKSG